MKHGNESYLNINKAPTAMEAPQEISHPQCTIDVSKVESLMEPHRISRGPECKECQCSICSKIRRCHLLSPTTMYYCENECFGKTGIGNCEYADKENDR